MSTLVALVLLGVAASVIWRIGDCVERGHPDLAVIGGILAILLLVLAAAVGAPPADPHPPRPPTACERRAELDATLSRAPAGGPARLCREALERSDDEVGRCLEFVRRLP
ncbi:MAG TPA: hypothetical protein VFD92_04850 [Candidatus Binatia bacterium]|nr:hypothetical protein [Candidatus Binatia bacterium]